jgi:hypothetical protein
MHSVVSRDVQPRQGAGEGGIADTWLIQNSLGHRNIQHTVRYAATNPARFERLWR